MTQNIPQGGNIPISASQLTVRVGWSPDRAGGGVDPSAFLLGPGSRVRGDADMVFYNQPRAEGGAVEFSPGDGGTARFSVDLAALPAAVEKIAFALTVHGDRGALGQLSSLWMELSDESTGGGIARFEPETRGRGEAALILGELYRRKGKWKFRAVGQGFEGGLAPLATHFGVDVSGGDDARPEPQPQPAAPPRVPRPDAGAGTRERPREPLSLAVTPAEATQIDERLGPVLGWAEKRLPEAEQLAMDAARLMSCTSDRIDSYKDAGFFKRCWHAISGKRGEIERANQRDLIEMQKHSWRYLKILNERDVLLAHSVMTVKSQLLALADLESETRREVARLAGRIGDRLRGLEGRVAGLEVATEIHSWLLTLDTLDHHRDLPPGLRLLKVVGEFFSIKSDGWNTKEIKYLHKALQEVGLDWREEVTISGFVERLLGEIEAGSVGDFRELASFGAAGGAGPVPHGFVLDNVSVPSLAAISHVAQEYDACSEVVGILGGSLRVGRAEAVREVLMGQLARAVPELGASVSLGDLAVELLNAMRLARALFDRQTEADAEFAKLQQNEDFPPADIRPEDLGKHYYEVAHRYRYGSETEKNPELAFKNYKRAVEENYLPAPRELALCYVNGIGVEENKEDAFSWMKKGAENGDAVAQYFLGLYYKYGKGTPKDSTEAKQWQKRAFRNLMQRAENGEAESQCYVGDCYRHGTGTAEDALAALSWLHKSAQQKFEKAYMSIDMVYSHMDIGGELEKIPDQYTRQLVLDILDSDDTKYFMDVYLRQIPSIFRKCIDDDFYDAASACEKIIDDVSAQLKPVYSEDVVSLMKTILNAKKSFLQRADLSAKIHELTIQSTEDLKWLRENMGE